MLWLYQQLRLLRTAFCTKDSPRQMAAGIACGLMLGLLPKGNLLAVAVATLLFSTRMSLATGLLCAFLVSALAPLLDPVTHRLGQWLLTGPALVPLWQRLSRVPFAAWSAFNNTVVMGNLALGLLLMYPVYRSSLPWMERLRSRWGDDGSVGEDLTATDNTLDDPPQTILLFKDEDAPAAESVLDQRRSCA